MIRVALLSFWHVHAEYFIRDVLENPDVELVAAWDEDAGRGRRRAAEIGIVFVPVLDDLLARADIDGVIVQTPTSMHEEIITRAAKAGKHVFTDKVLAPTLAEANRIVAVCDSAGIALVTAMGMLMHNYILQIKDIIGSGELGRIISIRMMSGHGRAVLDTLPEGFYRRAEAVGGVLMDICHPLYVTPFLLGMPDTVYARFAFITQRELEDSVSVMMDFADGAHVSFDVSFAMRGAPAMQIEVTGTEGSVFYRSGAGSASSGPSLGTVFEKRIGEPGNNVPLILGKSPGPTIRPWVDHIVAGTRPDTNIDQALKLSLLTEAAYQSATTGRAVSVSDITG